MHDFTNIIWRCMAGSQRHLTAGTDRARRYLKGFSPIVAFADPERPDFAALEAVCEPGERFYCSEWSGALPDRSCSECGLVTRWCCVSVTLPSIRIFYIFK